MSECIHGTKIIMQRFYYKHLQTMVSLFLSFKFIDELNPKGY